jgi:hypothetical protein
MKIRALFLMRPWMRACMEPSNTSETIVPARTILASIQYVLLRGELFEK